MYNLILYADCIYNINKYFTINLGLECLGVTQPVCNDKMHVGEIKQGYR